MATRAPSVLRPFRLGPRWISAVFFLALLVVGTAGLAAAQSATPAASPAATPAADTQQLLAVADPASQRLSVYTLPDLALAGELTGIEVNDHAGFLPLPNGELLFIDVAASRLVSVGLDPLDGELEIRHEAPVSGTVSHIAVDPDHLHFAAVGTDDPAAPITLVNLETWETTPVALPSFGEVGLALTHDVLFHRNDDLNQVEVYRLEDVLAGTVEALSTAGIAPGGHGESLDFVDGVLYTATDAGIEAIAWDGETLTHLATYAWETADRSGGRGYFQRLSFDAGHIVSYASDRSAPEAEWTTWTNDAYVVDLATDAVSRVEIGPGYVYRFGLAQNLALFSRLGEDGDEAVVLDLDLTSTTYGQITTRIPLPAMTAGPQPGASIYDANQYRIAAVTPDGALGFVTQGGDGRIAVLDLAAGAILATIETPSPLDAGGYLAVFGTPDTFADTIGR